jgi:hypothetical protein
MWTAFTTGTSDGLLWRFERWAVCTPFAVNVFATLATQEHLEYHCKALFRTPCIWKQSIQPKLASENNRTISEWTNDTLVLRHVHEQARPNCCRHFFFLFIRLKDWGHNRNAISHDGTAQRRSGKLWTSERPATCHAACQERYIWVFFVPLLTQSGLLKQRFQYSNVYRSCIPYCVLYRFCILYCVLYRLCILYYVPYRFCILNCVLYILCILYCALYRLCILYCVLYRFCILYCVLYRLWTTLICKIGKQRLQCGCMTRCSAMPQSSR